MSNKVNAGTKKLETLVDQYQSTSAPLGFANRLMAQVEQDRKHRIVFNPGYAVAASVAIVALVSVVIVNNIEDKKPELQIAEQDNPAQITTPAPQPEPALEESAKATTKEKPTSLPAEQTKTMVAAASKAVEPQAHTSSVKITREEREQFFQASNDSDSTSLAVLTDVSDWLVEQKDVAAPDLSELPDMDEIDSLFNTT